MKRAVVFAGVLFAMAAAPFAAHAQGGVPGGAAHGFNEGARIAGPVGAVVGTAVGGVIGGVEGVLGIRHASATTDFVEPPPPRSYRYRKVVRHYKPHKRKVVRHYRRGPSAGYVN